MRSENQVSVFLSRNKRKNPRLVRYYEACIPQDSWSFTGKDVAFNSDIFEDIFRRYVSRINIVRKNGYSLFLCGDNGSGKTLFACWALKQALLQRGDCFSAYYSTLKGLDNNFRRSFSDRELYRSLQEDYLLRDFLVIDEVGKESAGDKQIKSQFEDILKSRYDNNLPTIVISNLTHEDFVKEYGSSVASMLEGKYKIVPFEGGSDCRKMIRKQMEEHIYG